MIVSCEASSKFQRKAAKMIVSCDAFPTIFTERGSKTSVSRDASDTFHRKSLQNAPFVRGFLQISQNHASKTSISREASATFQGTSFQNDRFVRGPFQISQNNKLPKRAFRAMLPTIFTKNVRFATVRAIDTPFPARGFIRQKQMYVPRTTTPCIPKRDNVRFASAPCAKMYESINREPTRFAHTKM